MWKTRNAEEKPKYQDASVELFNGITFRFRVGPDGPNLGPMADCPNCNGRAKSTGGYEGGMVLVKRQLSGSEYEYAQACPECVYGAMRHAHARLPWAPQPPPKGPVQDRHEAVAALLKRIAKAPEPTADETMTRRILFLIEQHRENEIPNDTTWPRHRLLRKAQSMGLFLPPDKPEEKASESQPTPEPQPVEQFQGDDLPF